MHDHFLRECTVSEDWRGLTAHPHAKIFPLADDTEQAALEADIEKTGRLLDAIVLYEGLILDGRNRFAACIRCGIEPWFVTYCGDDPLGFVISKNLHRRNLSQAAKNEVVTKLLIEYPERSDRALGLLAQVDGKTVAVRRAELEATAEIPQSKIRKDRKGRWRPAHKAASSASADNLAAEVIEDVAAAFEAGGDALPEDFGEPSGLKSKSSRIVEAEAPAVRAFACLLLEGNINRRLYELLRVLRDEGKRTAALPESERDALARFLSLLEIFPDELGAIVAVPGALMN